MELGELSGEIVQGNAAAAEKRTREALSEGMDPLVILNQGLVAGMNAVGDKFRNGEYFIPQVLLSARAMKTCVAFLRPHLARREGAGARCVVIGTVQGDLHDIGKNLVAMMLEGAGFDVVDLGSDVAPQSFVQAVQSHDARMLCMSALLTTTRPAMKATIDFLKDSAIGNEVKVMVGGAPVTQEYAAEIGADGYAPDAATAAERATELMGAGSD